MQLPVCEADSTYVFDQALRCWGQHHHPSPASEGIFDVFQLAHSQVDRKAESQVAEPAECVQGTFEPRLGHVAPGLVVRLHQGARLAQQVQPGNQPLFVECHAHQRLKLRIGPSFVGVVLAED